MRDWNSNFLKIYSYNFEKESEIRCFGEFKGSMDEEKRIRDCFEKELKSVKKKLDERVNIVMII